jgi:hypothetical protein
LTRKPKLRYSSVCVYFNNLRRLAATLASVKYEMPRSKILLLGLLPQVALYFLQQYPQYLFYNVSGTHMWPAQYDPSGKAVRLNHEKWSGHAVQRLASLCHLFTSMCSLHFPPLPTQSLLVQFVLPISVSGFCILDPNLCPYGKLIDFLSSEGFEK